jgi:hypothetical protein
MFQQWKREKSKVAGSGVSATENQQCCTTVFQHREIQQC